MENRHKLEVENLITFSRYFQTDDDCYRYLSDIKLSNGYTCKKYGHTNYGKGQKLYSRRCAKCNYY
jgi:hypothetical protein